MGSPRHQIFYPRKPRHPRLPSFCLTELVAVRVGLAILAVTLGTGGCNSNRASENRATADSRTATQDQTVDQTNWPVFRGNAMATGVAEGTLTDNPQLLWKFSVPKGSFSATPVVVDDTVYIGDLDGTFYALDLITDRRRWKFDLGADKIGFALRPRCEMDWSTSATPTVRSFVSTPKPAKRNGRSKPMAKSIRPRTFIRITCLFGSQDATLYCLNAKTGELQWKHQIGDQIRCSPTVDSRSLFSRRLRWQVARDRSGQRRGNRRRLKSIRPPAAHRPRRAN